MMPALLVPLGQLLGPAFACGLNLYATVAVLGLGSRLGWLPDLPPGLRGLEHELVIGSAISLFLVEFVVDKIPRLDTVWDTLHTFIRPVAAALLALTALAAFDPHLQLTGSALAGVAALLAHGAKAGLRLALHATRHRILTRAISIGEDAAAAALTIVALRDPTAAASFAIAILLAGALFGPRFWRAFMLGVRAVNARFRGFFHAAGWREPAELPAGLGELITPQPLGAGRPRLSRAALTGMRRMGGLRNGWLLVSEDGSAFLYRSLFRSRRLELLPAADPQIERGAWADRLAVDTAGRRCTLFLLKDGPAVELVAGALRATAR